MIQYLLTCQYIITEKCIVLIFTHTRAHMCRSSREASRCLLLMVGPGFAQNDWTTSLDQQGMYVCTCILALHHNDITINLFTCLQEKLTEFILASQDEETGGFSDRPGNMVSWQL